MNAPVIEQEHSNVCGGSSAARRLYCPASRTYEDAAPKTTSEFAERGSMLHAATELVLTNFPENMKQAQPLINECVGKDFGFDFDPITDELVATKLGPALTTWFAIVKEYQLDDWFIETRVSMETIIPGAFGKADIIAKDEKNRLHIIDWKFGDGVPVPAEGNEGLLFYAAAALNDEDPELREFTVEMYEDTPVFLHIVQPTDRVDSPHDVWETTVEHVENFVDSLVESVKLSYEPEPVAKPGDYCRWCAAAITCPANRQLVGATSKKKLEGMDAAEIGIFLSQLQMVASLKEKAFGHAQKLMEQGAVIPGWKLVNKRATRQWRDEDAALELCKKSRMKQGEYMQMSLKSPPQMEKANKKLYEKKLEEFVHSPSSGLTIAPDKDKRPAVTGSMELLSNALDKAKA